MPKKISTTKSVVLIGTAQAWSFIVTFLAAPILSRLLQPADFGLVATSGPIVAFVAMIQNLGFTQAIIQRDTITKGQINALFWVSVAFSSALISLLWALAPTIAAFFGEPRLADVIAASGALTLISVIAGQPIALLTRGLHFKALACLEIFGTTIGAILGVAVAWYTRSYWALLVPLACTRTVDLVGAAIWARWIPGRPVWDYTARQMMGFGAGLSTFNLMNFFARNADNLMIAKVHGTTALGFYDRAYKLMLLPLTQATGPMSRVVTPILSRLQNEPVEYRRTYADAVTFLMLLVQPGALCAVIFASSTITIFLGTKWSAAAPIFAWLGVAGLHQIFTSALGWLFISQGRIRDLAILGGVNSISTVVSFGVGLPWGPLGVAIAYVSSDYIIRLPLTWYIAGRAGHVRLKDIYQIAGPHALGLSVSALILIAIKAQIPNPSLIGLAILAGGSYGVNAAVLLLFPAKRRLFIKAARTARKLARSILNV